MLLHVITMITSYEFINNQFCLKTLFKIFYFMNKNANNGVIKKNKIVLANQFFVNYTVLKLHNYYDYYEIYKLYMDYLN